MWEKRMINISYKSFVQRWSESKLKDNMVTKQLLKACCPLGAEREGSRQGHFCLKVLGSAGMWRLIVMKLKDLSHPAFDPSGKVEI